MAQIEKAKRLPVTMQGNDGDSCCKGQLSAECPQRVILEGTEKVALSPYMRYMS